MRTHRWLIVALVIGLAIRIPLLVHAQHQGVPGDQLQYSAQAMANADGDWFQQPFHRGWPAAEHPPLTSLVLTPVTRLVGEQHMQLAQRLMVLLAAQINIALLWLLGRRWSPRVAGLVAVLGAIDAHLFLGDVLLYSETFGTTLLLTLLLILVPARPGMVTVRRVAAVGGLLGLLMLTRAELALLVPLICGWLWWVTPDRRSLRSVVRPLLAAATAALVVTPWVGWNLARFEEPVVFSTNDGLTFLGANCDDTYYGENIGGWNIWCGLLVEGRPGDDASVAAAERMDRARSYIASHTRRLPLVMAARVARQWEVGWIGRLASDSYDEGRPPWLVLAGSLQWYAYAGLGLLGLSRVGRRERVLLLLLLVQVTAVAALVEAQWRLRAPAEPAILVFAAFGLGRLLDAAPTRSLTPAR